MAVLYNKLEHLNISAIQTQVCKLYGGNRASVHFQVESPFALSSTKQAHYVTTSRENKITYILIPIILS